MKYKMTKEAKEQYNKPLSYFREKVKCCYNCDNWKKSGLAMEHSTNMCLIKGETLSLTAWDYCCKQYSGTATEENLIYNESKAEQQEKLKDLIKDKLKVSISKFAEDIGVSRQTVYNIMNGDCLASVPTVKTICEYFNVDFKDYLNF